MDCGGFHLPPQFLEGQGIGRGPHCVGSAVGDHVGIAARSALDLCSAFQCRQGILIPGPPDPRPQEVIQEEVATPAIKRWLLASEDQHAVEARTGGGRRRLAAVVRLHRADGHHRIGALSQGIGNEQLQLAHLVTARGQAGWSSRLIQSLGPPSAARRRSIGSRGVGKWARG